MDPSLTSGGIIAMIGIGTVFFALVTLIAIITLISRLSPQADASAAPVASATPEPGPAADVVVKSEASEPEESEVDYQQVALAAYAHHRRITTRIKSSTPASSWDAAGRIRELNQRRTGTSWT